MAVLLIFLAIHLCQAEQTDSLCPVNCQSCFSQNTCYRCRPGYFNDTRIGECIQCPKGCTSCSSLNDCVSCESGYYFSDGRCYSCSGDPHSWQCSKGCVNGFYGPLCKRLCSEGCRDKKCNKQSGVCVKGCLEGYNGETCERCSEWCLNMTCEQVDGRCTHGCVDGYYQYARRCEKCSDNCETCSSSSSCTPCFEGSYTVKCDTSCPHCKPGGCYFRNGTCTHGCKDWYYQGTNMCLHCPDKCSKCTSTAYCEECQSGYFGKICEQRCLNNCLACDDNINCNTCRAGYFGQSCNKNCSQTCNRCNKESGLCKDCIDGYFKEGDKCLPCPGGCHKTSNAVSSCFQANGTCLYGCVRGFTGHNCTKEIPTFQQRPMVLAITGSATGGVLIVVAAVALILLVRSRRNKVTKSPVCEDSNPQHVRPSIRNPTYDASIINNSARSEVKPDSDDHVYAVVQKVQLKQNPASGMDKSETDDNVYDVTSTERPPAKAQRHTRSGAAKTGDDTYSHISHVNKMGRFVNEHQVDCETVYDHVSHDVGLPSNEGTYNVAGSLQSQSCGRRTENMRTNSPNLVDGRQDEDDTYSHTNQRFVTSNTDHATYNTTCDLMLPQSMKDDQAD